MLSSAAAVAFVLLTKFTFALFFAIGAVALMVARRRWPLRQGALALLVALTLVYGVYLSAHAGPRFLLGVVKRRPHQRAGTGRLPSSAKCATPAGGITFPSFWRSRRRFPSYFWRSAARGSSFGKRSIPRSRPWPPAILLSVLPIAPTSASATSCRFTFRSRSSQRGASIRLWRTPWLRPLVGALAAWLVAGSLLAHPDYLPWMNAFAGPHPERVVLDSNFDWGQDVVRLRDACRRKRHPCDPRRRSSAPPISRGSACRAAQANQSRHGDDGMVRRERVVHHPGADAGSEGVYVADSGRGSERVGKSIRLYEAYRVNGVAVRETNELLSRHPRTLSAAAGCTMTTVAPFRSMRSSIASSYGCFGQLYRAAADRSRRRRS